MPRAVPRHPLLLQTPQPPAPHSPGLNVPPHNMRSLIWMGPSGHRTFFRSYMLVTESQHPSIWVEKPSKETVPSILSKPMLVPTRYFSHIEEHTEHTSILTHL